MSQNPEQNPNIEAQFKTGADAWILLNSDHFWWKEIDFRTQFYFSNLQKKINSDFIQSKTAVIERIVQTTELPQYDYQINSSLLFFPAHKFFPTKWIILVTDQNKNYTAELIPQLQSMKIQSLRVFAPLKIESSLKTSLQDIELISDPI